ncbi:hypothetical protein AJ78_08979, partial [Emergomyces pasteurianus Ep9510]
VDEHEEYYVKKILKKKIRYRQKHYLIKWVSWTAPTWVKTSLMKETQTLDNYLQRTTRGKKKSNVRD